MFQIRIPITLALLLTLLPAITVFAKGSFSFIAITGPTLIKTVRLTDPALVTDFFAFADFSSGKGQAPDDLGVGYEITRYYIDQSRVSAFDHLHYYPDAGFVYYDGIVNGSSEYNGKWYPAKPDIKKIFESALSAQVYLMTLGAPAAAQAMVPPTESVRVSVTVPPVTPGIKTQPSMLLIVAAGVAILLVLAFWGFCKAVPR